MGDRLAELEAELMDLYETLDERDRRIEELEAGASSSPTRAAAQGDEEDIGKIAEERDMLVADLEKYRDELMESKDQVAEFQAQIVEKNMKVEDLERDKRTLSETVEGQKKLIEGQRKKLAATTKSHEEQKRLHKDGTGAQYQLELENQRLRTNVTELEENEQELVAELEMISSERAELEKSNEELVAKCDGLQNALDSKSNRVVELERDYEELSLKVEAENDAQQEWEEKTAKKAESHRKERAKLLDDLEIERNRVRNLEAKVESLKDTTVQGEMQKQIDTLRSEVTNYKSELESSLVDKEQIEVDLENVYRALEDANDRQEERLMEAIAKERQELKQLEAQVAAQVAAQVEAQVEVQVGRR